MKKNSRLFFRSASPLCVAIMGLLFIGTHSCWGADSKPEAYFFKGDSANCFAGDHLTGATYYRFDTNGFFEETAREHMGIFPFRSGTWKQDTNGTVTLVATNKTSGFAKEDRACPMMYKNRVFLLWPDKSWVNNTQAVIDKIDFPAKKLHVYNPFLISEGDYTNALGKSYPFKYYPHLNPPESK